MKACHFVGKTLRDGQPIPDDGVKLVYDGKIELCASGYHASIHPFDALQYAPGNTLCLVECEGEILHQADKLVCTERTIIKRINAEPLMYDFARWCALEVIDLWNAPDVVVEYLNTGNESLMAAAGDAAGAAARAAAGDAARAAAGDAAGAAAGAAAGDAAWAAAGDAARAAAGDAARAAAGDAAWDAAWAAARAAARAAQRDEFERIVNIAFDKY